MQIEQLNDSTIAENQLAEDTETLKQLIYLGFLHKTYDSIEVVDLVSMWQYYNSNH